MKERRRSICMELGTAFNELMTHITGDVAAEAIGVSMFKEDDKIVAGISERAAGTYFHPQSGETLGTILDTIVENKCQAELGLTITRVGQDYFVIQQLTKND